MALGALLNTPWVLAFALCGLSRDTPLEDRGLLLSPEFITPLIFTLSVANGLGQAVQWVGQGKYLSDCATEGTKGFFFSLFWAFYMASQIVGNLVAALSVSQLKQQYLFVIMASISFVSFVCCLFLKAPVPGKDMEPAESKLETISISSLPTA